MKWFFLIVFLYVNAAVATYVVAHRDCEKLAVPPFTHEDIGRRLEYGSCKSWAPLQGYSWPLYWMHRFYDRVLPTAS